MMIRNRANCLRLLGALAIGFSIFSATPSAFAADDDATIQMARERFKEGVQFFDQKQYDKARAAFLQAYALKKHPAVLLNLAQSELRSGHEADAARHFAQYLREEKNPTPAEKTAADAGLQAAKAATLEATIQTDVEEAEVYVDGNLEGKTPLPGPVYLTPGAHNVELRKGDRSVAERVTGNAGQTTSVTLALRPKAAPEGAPPATQEKPEAEPEEREHEEATAEPEPSEAGGGRKPFFKWLFTTPPGLIGFGLTAVGVGSGIGFAIGARQSYNSADSVAAQIENQAQFDSKGALGSDGVCTDPQGWLERANFGGNRDDRAYEYWVACDKFRNNVNNGDTMKTVSIVSWIVAGTAATGTVIYYFVAAPKESASAKPTRFNAMLAPILGPNERGLSIVGQF